MAPGQQDSASRGLFRQFQRDHRFLSARLRAIAQPLLAMVRQFDAERFLADDESLVQELIGMAMFEPPKLLGAEVASSREQGGKARPGFQRGTWVPTNRHYIAIQVEGDHELLEFWPDQDDDGLVPIDAELADLDVSTSDTTAYDYEKEMRRHELLLTTELWSIGLRDGPDSWALFTFVDLTSAEEEEVSEGRLNPRSLADHNRARIEPIVERIANQAARFLQEELPQTLRQAVADRRRRVSAQAAVRQALTWPQGWKAEPPKLELLPLPASDEIPRPTDIALSHRPRLAPATFIEVQRIIRVWADGVERYPAAFGGLHEDRLSDLLAATLNASLPGANREVYSRGGKSDIFIRADVLSEGAGPAKVFICECKWWSGRSNFSAHLDQLFGYLEAKDTAAVLVYFVGTQQPGKVRADARAAFTTPEWTEELEAVAAGWPVVRYRSFDGFVDTCIAFIDLPRPKRRGC